MRDAHRDAVHPDRQRHVVLLDQLPDGAGEPVPLVVRLDTFEQQELDTGVVGEQVQAQVRRRVVDEPVLGERHLRPPGPVVVQEIDVEPREQPAVQHLEQVIGRDPARLTRVHEPVQRMHQHLRRRRRAGRHRLVDDLVEVVRSQHGRLLHTVANRAGRLPILPSHLLTPEMRAHIPAVRNFQHLPRFGAREDSWKALARLAVVSSEPDSPLTVMLAMSDASRERVLIPRVRQRLEATATVLRSVLGPASWPSRRSGPRCRRSTYCSPAGAARGSGPRCSTRRRSCGRSCTRPAR